MIPVGIDVGSRELVVAARVKDKLRRRSFSNSQAGPRQLLSWLAAGPKRVAVEATGFYSLDVCLALDEAPDVEVMVANPRSVASLAKALMRRGKTDAIDAQVLVEYAERMPFVAWKRPSSQSLELRRTRRSASGGCMPDWIPGRGAPVRASRKRPASPRPATSTCDPRSSRLPKPVRGPHGREDGLTLK